MTLSAGTRLGPYEIQSPLGAGGMGEVYVAKDARLGREVALKVLPAKVAVDPDRLRRFEKEARSASALNHPNIVAIFDIGTTDGVSWIAMEKVPGKTLGAMLTAPLPVKQLLQLAVQIADGLAQAHEAGVVHRDLKPENVMVTPEGRVKLLDFGLAKLTDPDDGDESASELTTQAGTRPGEVMGTVGYMSPEQASGRAIDFRTDQFALGALLYEMATGRRAFQGKTDIDTLAAILNDEPEAIARRRPETPAPLGWIVERCLAKSPQDRFSSTRDLAHDLASLRDHLGELSGEPGRLPRLTARSGRARRLRLAAAIALAVAAVAAAVLLLNRPAKPVTARPAVRFSIAPPSGTTFNFATTVPAPPALSPAGDVLVFGAKDSEGRNTLWLRPLDGMVAKPIPGTEGATYPFWSPDGAFLGYFAAGKLMKVDVNGGPAETLADAPDGRGGTWNRDGTILFAPSPRGPILKISAGGGDAAAVTRLDPTRPNLVHRWPQFLPDGRHFLYYVHDPDPPGKGQGVWLGALDSADSARLLPDASNAVYAPPGYLVFVREGALFAAPFDLNRMQVTGAPRSVLKEVRYQPYRWYGMFTLSQNGVLAYQPGVTLEASKLVWLDRTGKAIGTLGAQGDYEGLRLSPDGTRCAVEVREGRRGSINIWIADIARAVTTRLTNGEGINDSPVWSPDGQRIAFSSNRRGRFDLYQIPALGGSEDLVLDSEAGKSPTDWSPDGRRLVFHQAGMATRYRWEIWGVPMPPGPSSPLFPQVANERAARFSPDGEWVAYCSDEAGNQEVYVREMTPSGGKLRVSKGGGSLPIWRRDGRELFYLSPDNRLMAVSIRPGRPLQVGEPEALFEARVRDTASDASLYDAAASGERFLVNTRIEGAPDPPLSVVLNWESDLKR